MHQYTYRSHPPVDSKHIHNNAVDFEKTYWCHVTNITKAIYFFHTKVTYGSDTHSNPRGTPILILYCFFFPQKVKHNLNLDTLNTH